ncbi:efflux RND transporter periplasmic adaptor subunit [Rhodohalobacter sp. 8-1]|uniref:efflux RND transporter periplasmic adaptor subunit n=1 Tax=Rhodohalobacter sp. 8-1 TaxID=3131972 RepID=UPI0030EC8526
MNKALLSFSILLLLTITASCSGVSADKSSEQSSEAAAAEIGSPQITFFTVETEQIADRVSLNGRLRAENRVELFPEVPGKVVEGTKPFREGVSFQEREMLVQLDDSEARLQIQSSRSKFKTLVSALMPDIKLDYPETLPRYEKWFNSLNAENNLVAIPEFGEGVRRYLESKGVYELYYTIKSAEDRLEKFTIRAPFSGVLSAAKAEPGQVVGPQFHLGTFVDSSLMILNASIDPAQVEWIRPGMTMAVSNQGQTESYKAEIVRVNPSVDSSSQQVLIYLEVSGEKLREGMYLEGEIESETKRELARIPKSALLRTGGVLAKRDGNLVDVTVEIHDLERSHLWVSGLQNGDEIVMDVSEPVSGRIINYSHL